MNPKFVFKLCYWAPKSGAKTKRMPGYSGKVAEEIEITETIVAETIQQALEYWKVNLLDEAIKFRYLVREEAVLTVITTEKE